MDANLRTSPVPQLASRSHPIWAIMGINHHKTMKKILDRTDSLGDMIKLFHQYPPLRDNMAGYMIVIAITPTITSS